LTIWGGGSGGAVNLEKLDKCGVFNLQTGDGILMKFYILKDIVSQSSHFKSRPDLVTFRGVGGGNLKSWKTLSEEGSG